MATGAIQKILTWVNVNLSLVKWCNLGWDTQKFSLAATMNGNRNPRNDLEELKYLLSTLQRHTSVPALKWQFLRKESHSVALLTSPSLRLGRKNKLSQALPLLAPSWLLGGGWGVEWAAFTVTSLSSNLENYLYICMSSSPQHWHWATNSAISSLCSQTSYFSKFWSPHLQNSGHIEHCFIGLW